MAHILHHFDLSRVQALAHAPLKGPATLMQHPNAPVQFDGPTAASIAAAKAAQRAERARNGLCEECGRPREQHYDKSQIILLGCPKGWA